MFNPPEMRGGGIPKLNTHPKQDRESFNLFGVKITPARVEHGSLKQCFGYRIGNIGYVPDVKVMPEESKKVFLDLDILILNLLKHPPAHSTHLTLDDSVALAKELNPKFCYFTHMNHDIHYEKDKRYLPDNMDFAYDGLYIAA